MRPFKDQPIGTKAAILGLAPTVCALLVASLAFLVSVYLAVRRNVNQDVATSAAVIADSERNTSASAQLAVREIRVMASPCNQCSSRCDRNPGAISANSPSSSRNLTKTLTIAIEISMARALFSLVATAMTPCSVSARSLLRSALRCEALIRGTRF